MDPILVTASQAAEAIGVGRTTIYALIKEGSLPSVRIRSSVRVPVEALKKWAADKTEK